MRGMILVGVSAVAVAAGVFAVSNSVAQPGASAPKARYWMDAETTSGLGAAGANPMRMMMGGGGSSTSHSLILKLGSQLPASGTPDADHFMPPAAGLGASVPLVTPVSEPSPDMQNFERPKGRLRIYWGCGERAGPGQPVVIDFAKLAAGQMPPGLFSTSVPVETGPSKANSRTFGTWPNTQRTKSLSGNSSIRGAHRIAGNYSPEIAFTLNQDFMAPLRASGRDAAGGAVALSWQGIAGATGYYANAMGAAESRNADVVWWTSANSQQFGAGLSSWLSPATVSRLIGQKIVMPPSQTSCTIPAEVKQAAGEGLIAFLTAYGPEADFAYPPRPANPKAAWKPEWTAKARFRSTTMIMPGFDMEAAMRGEDMDEDEGPRRPDNRKQKCKRGGGLGGMLGGALGGLTGSGC